MKITTTTVTYGRKLNLGDFNQAHVEVTLIVEHEDGDKPEDVFTEAFTQAKLAVAAQLLPLHRRQSEKVKEVFGNLPREVQQHIIQELEDANR